ncbi:MAG: 2,3-dimethylmalate dehydratase large subunit [Firmicutes bacterium ADurb.Bin080]|jgi:aconitate hydratase|nr:hydratase [Clostridiales bacterium]OQC12664.1 MAG: 2,3-dimethylmalate dehydratase large subunit [Firmicutes bacterium ADurb.Bin080]
MIKITNGGHSYNNGSFTKTNETNGFRNTITYKVLAKHQKNNILDRDSLLKIKFDAVASHDITYVGIIQTAKSIGLKEFPIPYIMTNCHNSLCAVGGTINEDDHLFGLSAAKKYGGIYVPAHMAVIHTFMREEFASPGMAILGSDSHTRYGALGTIAVGEGGPEIVKQLIGSTYDIKYPEVVAVYLKGSPRKGVGPQDVAILLIGAVFKNGYAKNKVLEFIGPGVNALPMEYRIGIDVMTTETACLSSIWITDIKTKEYLSIRGRGDSFFELFPNDGAYYDGVIEIDLSNVEPMIALPFHPSNSYLLSEVINNPREILGMCQEEGRKLLKNNKFDLISKIDKNGRIKVDQAIIAGCAGGTYDNIFESSSILSGKRIGPDLSLSVYCGSQPIYQDLVKKGAISKLLSAGGVVKTSFCGPCFGAGDVPANNGLSIRHTTRNFENREGSKPGDGQIASVALMDARSISVTAANGGYLSSALDYDYENSIPEFVYDNSAYRAKVYNGFNQSRIDEDIIYGPNIADWPEISPLKDVLLLEMVSVINDPVTTTDEIIPSGETSSYRSNPIKLAEFTLSRKDPSYVGRAKKSREYAENLINDVRRMIGFDSKLDIQLGSVIFAVKPGDGSAREQAASCQRVLGGSANIAREYATKRYRSNLINWGILPLIASDRNLTFEIGDILVIMNPKQFVYNGGGKSKLLRNNQSQDIELSLGDMTEEEKGILVAGCLMNFQKEKYNEDI